MLFEIFLHLGRALARCCELAGDRVPRIYTRALVLAGDFIQPLAVLLVERVLMFLIPFRDLLGIRVVADGILHSGKLGSERGGGV